MASLTRKLATFEAFGDYVPIPMPCQAADQFFRGGLVFYVAGRIDPLVADTNSEFAGIVAEDVTTTAQDQTVLVYPASLGGLFLFANASFTIANSGLLFHQTVAGEDDPSTLTTVAAGNSGAVGRLVVVRTTGVDGWLAIGDRATPVNAV